MQESLSKYLLDYSMQCDREIDHAEFDTCEELMDEYLKGNSFDVILLDIEFKNNDEKQMNGIELGKRLRGLYANDNTAIVYVTSYGEYAIDSIKIRPYDYIKKPITYERIVEFFETYYLDQAKRKKVFEYTAHKVKNSIIVSNICYFESQGRTIVIHTITNQYTFYGKLSNLLDNESLSDFISIHKSYLVNKNYIERFTSHSVVLIGIDRVELPISPNKKMEVSEQLLKE